MLCVSFKYECLYVLWGIERERENKKKVLSLKIHIYVYFFAQRVTARVSVYICVYCISARGVYMHLMPQCFIRLVWYICVLLARAIRNGKLTGDYRAMGQLVMQSLSCFRERAQVSDSALTMRVFY